MQKNRVRYFSSLTLTVLVAVALVLSGCSGGDQTTSSTVSPLGTESGLASTENPQVPVTGVTSTVNPLGTSSGSSATTSPQATTSGLSSTTSPQGSGTNTVQPTGSMTATSQSTSSTTATVQPTGSATSTVAVSGTPSTSNPVIMIPVTGTTNLVLASQIIGFNVFLNEGPGTVGGTTQTPSTGTTPTVRPTVQSTSATGTTSTPAGGISTGTPAAGTTTTPSTVQSTATQSTTGLVGSTGLVETPLGTVVDIAVLDNVFFGTGSTVVPGTSTTPTVTRTPQSTQASSPTGTPTVGSISTTGTPTVGSTSATGGSTPSTSATAVPTTTSQGSTGTSGLGSSMSSGQLVFVIVQVTSGAGLNTSSTRNLVAIPWNAIQVVPSENKLVVNSSLDEIKTFPFFGQIDWSTLGTGATLQRWFTFWSIPLPSNMMAPVGTATTVAPSMTVTPTP